MLGLAERTTHRPNQLSGGQQQRVSIARALMNGGTAILADEPTGALDSKSGAEVLQFLEHLADEGHTVIIITHDPDVARHARRRIEIKDGNIVADVIQSWGEKAASGAFRLKKSTLMATGRCGWKPPMVARSAGFIFTW